MGRFTGDTYGMLLDLDQMKTVMSSHTLKHARVFKCVQNGLKNGGKANK